jgi:hypothetical protein
LDSDRFLSRPLAIKALIRAALEIRCGGSCLKFRYAMLQVSHAGEEAAQDLAQASRIVSSQRS